MKPSGFVPIVLHAVPHRPTFLLWRRVLFPPGYGVIEMRAADGGRKMRPIVKVKEFRILAAA